MEITLTQSPSIIQEKVQLSWSQLSQSTIESLIAELYKSDYITFNQATWEETAEILEGYGCELYYDRDDYEDDLKTIYCLNSISENWISNLYPQDKLLKFNH